MSPNPAACIMAQTSCDITQDCARAKGIYLVPDYVVHKGRQYLSQVEIDSPELYRILRTSDKLPTSAPPSTEALINAFKRASDNGNKEIIFLTLSSKLSSSFSAVKLAAEIALEEGFPAPIHVYDSLSVSHGMGLLAEEAANLAMQGFDASSIIEKLDVLRPNTCVYCMLESLKCAHLGGRVGSLGPLATDTFGIRPIMAFIDGLMHCLGVQRNARESLKWLARRYDREAEKGRTAIIGHGDHLHRAQTLCEMVKDLDKLANLRISYIGPPIGIHSGPSTVGIAFIKQPQKT